MHLLLQKSLIQAMKRKWRVKKEESQKGPEVGGLEALFEIKLENILDDVCNHQFASIQISLSTFWEFAHTYAKVINWIRELYNKK